MPSKDSIIIASKSEFLLLNLRALGHEIIGFQTLFIFDDLLLATKQITEVT
jgi:hypothetical protein